MYLCEIMETGMTDYTDGKYDRSVRLFTVGIQQCPEHSCREMAMCYQYRASAYEKLVSSVATPILYRRYKLIFIYDTTYYGNILLFILHINLRSTYINKYN